MDAQFRQRMVARLAQPLPGRVAHRVFAPDLSYGRQVGPAPESARRAAVLILLYLHDGAWHLPLTLRPTDLAEHAGQISFPGGLVERGESTREAALREMEEELGVRDGIELVGSLSEFFVFVSNIRVTPWVGIIDHQPSWIPSPVEVAEVIEVPLGHLLDPANTGECLCERRGLHYRAPHFAWGEHRIWGATSMMLNELMHVARELGV